MGMKFGVFKYLIFKYYKQTLKLIFGDCYPLDLCLYRI